MIYMTNIQAQKVSQVKNLEQGKALVKSCECRQWLSNLIRNISPLDH